MPEMDVYVRSYGGWMLSVTSRLYAHMLTKELERVGASYNHSYHYGVGYDRYRRAAPASCCRLLAFICLHVHIGTSLTSCQSMQS